MSERRERIPAEEIQEPQKWKLPFWTEPNHLVQNEEQEEEEDVLVEEEEIEVEPLTAEQLEAIRQEAYNEGLEQGLIEGRQKGEKLGHEEGYQEGLKAGEEAGRKLGYDAGFESGETEAKAAGETATQSAIKSGEHILEQIESQLKQQRETLEAEIPNIIASLAKAVVMEELSQGSEHISFLVQTALAALPLESSDIEVRIHPNDLPFVEAAQEQSGLKTKLIADEKIEAGGCKVNSRYSAIDFTLDARWQSILEQYHNQLQLGQNALPEIQDDVDDATDESQAASEHESETEVDSIEDASDEPAAELSSETDDLLVEPGADESHTAEPATEKFDSEEPVDSADNSESTASASNDPTGEDDEQ